MGVYDSGLDFSIGEGMGKNAIYIAAAIVGLLLVGAVAYFASESLKPSALAFRFEKNPIKVGEQTKLFVNVTNISKDDAANVPLSLHAKEKTEFDVYALNEKFAGSIPNLSQGTSREVTFILNPVGKILPGTYVFVAKTTINGIGHSKETTLTVQE